MAKQSWEDLRSEVLEYLGDRLLDERLVDNESREAADALFALMTGNTGEPDSKVQAHVRKELRELRAADEKTKEE